ncbi:MAG: ABC transporter ATP-binding protein [Lachnospiraceae bacterium]|nr:ABC transporter ATP-binding protein [Lachnospiraceae bacterium]
MRKFAVDIKYFKIKIVSIILLLLLSTIINLIQPLLTQYIMDAGIYKADTYIVIKYSVISIGLYLILYAIGLVKEGIRISIKNDLNLNLWRRAINHISLAKLDKINEKNCVELTHCIESDISTITSVFDEGAMLAITEVLGIIGGIIGLFIVSNDLAIIILLITPIKLVGTIFMSKENMKLMQQLMQHRQMFSKWIGEYITGIEDIRLWGIQKKLHSVFEKIKQEELTSVSKRNIFNYLNISIDQLFIEIVIVVIYILGCHVYKNGNISVGGIIAYITFSTYILTPLSSIFNIFFIYAGVKPSLERLGTFLNWEKECNEGKLALEKIEEIRFDNVSFAYDNNRELFQQINLNIKENQKIILFGKNGSGKTTINRLLLRLFDPSEGHIYINNIEIKELELKKYREKISVMNTDFYLFNDSIYNNICIERNIDEAFWDEIIKICGLEETIDEKKLSYKIGENGELLSAGQRQKIALARALACGRELLILDEPTANMDYDSKRKFISKIMDRNFRKTVIIISHDIESLKKADNIIYLSEGQVSDIGSYEEIFNRNEKFRTEIATL